ncbi:unnamed protein product [Protopolystoma xenopodis]|uniref:Uncharacterized protein n=1 Tax=Protopolystoma xenopodis TaxID=117903 RepID=A0A3S5FBQ9_9PLAT|nr:unnamed protein product [Protopolystoma xenopodis]
METEARALRRADAHKCSEPFQHNFSRHNCRKPQIEQRKFALCIGPQSQNRQFKTQCPWKRRPRAPMQIPFSVMWTVLNDSSQTSQPGAYGEAGSDAKTTELPITNVFLLAG